MVVVRPFSDGPIVEGRRSVLGHGLRGYLHAPAGMTVRSPCSSKVAVASSSHEPLAHPPDRRQGPSRPARHLLGRRRTHLCRIRGPGAAHRRRPGRASRPEAPATRVALAMENCPEYFPLLYGIWRAGLSAVPMNNKLHPKEMAWILADSETKLCIASPKLAGGLSSSASAPCRRSSPPARTDHRALLGGDPIMGEPWRQRRRSLAVLHQRHHRPAERRHAQPPQPAVRLPLLLRRHRLDRHARHHPARRAADARLGPLRPRPHRARRQQRHPRRLVRARAGLRRAERRPTTSACSPRPRWCRA